MAKTPMHPEKTVLKAVLGSHGIITTVAERLGMSWQGAKEAIMRSEVCKAALFAEKETMVDVAENRLLAAINEGDPWAIRFFLNNQAKGRGYGWRNYAVANIEPPKVIGLYADDTDIAEDSESDPEEDPV